MAGAKFRILLVFLLNSIYFDKLFLNQISADRKLIHNYNPFILTHKIPDAAVLKLPKHSGLPN